MSDVLAARAAFEQAQKDAKAVVEAARLNFGKAIATARDRKVPQDAIAKKLGLTREQVRRYQRQYEEWVEKNGREPAVSS